MNFELKLSPLEEISKKAIIDSPYEYWYSQMKFGSKKFSGNCTYLFDDMGTEMKIFVEKKNAEPFELTSYVEQFLNFIRRFTKGSCEVNHQNPHN